MRCQTSMPMAFRTRSEPSRPPASFSNNRSMPKLFAGARSKSEIGIAQKLVVPHPLARAEEDDTATLEHISAIGK